MAGSHAPSFLRASYKIFHLEGRDRAVIIEGDSKTAPPNQLFPPIYSICHPDKGGEAGGGARKGNLAELE